MTVLLVAVTFGALGVAGALLFYLLRLTREERDRSEARAAALAEMIGGAGSGGSLGSEGSSSSSASTTPWARARVERESPPARSSERPGTATEPVAATPLEREPMFGGAMAAGSESRPRLLLVPAIGVVIVGLALGSIYAWSRPQSAVAAVPAASAPLELVSLRHERQGGSLIVSGLVRNPHAGQAAKGLAAVAFTFDRQGTFLASGRAVLDFPQLQPGDESPFSISVPQSGQVARYRVSFRTDERVVPHVDRREPPAAATAAAGVRQ